MQDDRLLAMTYALGDAVSRRDWPEIEALFNERAQLLESVKIEPSKALTIVEADEELRRRLDAERETVLSRLRQTRKVVAARKLYLKSR